MTSDRLKNSVRLIYRHLAVVLPALLCCTPLGAAETVHIERGISYLRPERAEKADLYQPATPTPGRRSPGIVIIHGGGWVGGKRDASRELNIGTNLALHGYVALSIDYLLASKDHPVWPTNLYDCKTAVRWLRKNADRLNVDADHIGVIGGSAGGHLATMVAVTGPESGLDPKEPYGEFSCKVQAAVDLYGPADLMTWHDTSMLPGSRAQVPELYRQATPATHADKHDPPILILHGTADKTVALEQSQTLAAALKAAGVEHKLVIIEGAPHSFHLQPSQQDLRPMVIGFFDKHLKPARSPARRGEP